MADRPHRLLRDGGLGQRDVTAAGPRAGRRCRLTPASCWSAGAVTVLAPAPNGHLLPTREFDAWIRRPAVERWLLVARAWLDSDRLFSRSAQPDSHPLGPEADLPYAATLRRLADRAAGRGRHRGRARCSAIWPPRCGGTDRGWVGCRCGWSRASSWILLEAAWLGLDRAGGHVLVDHGAAGRAKRPFPSALDALFPEPVETIIVQADLTAVAAGPLPHQLAAELRLLADQESRGGGGVYRFSSGSLAARD